MNLRQVDVIVEVRSFLLGTIPKIIILSTALGMLVFGLLGWYIPLGICVFTCIVGFILRSTEKITYTYRPLNIVIDKQTENLVLTVPNIVCLYNKWYTTELVLTKKTNTYFFITNSTEIIDDFSLNIFKNDITEPFAKISENKINIDKEENEKKIYSQVNLIGKGTLRLRRGHEIKYSRDINTKEMIIFTIEQEYEEKLIDLLKQYIEYRGKMNEDVEE